MLNLNAEAERQLIIELGNLPRHFQVFPESVELGCAWEDLTTAAAIMSRSAFWPSSTERWNVKPRPIDANRLAGVRRLIDVKTRVVFTIFIIRGPWTTGGGENLRAMRMWLCSGMLHIHKPDYLENLDKLAGIYCENREIGRAKLRDMALNTPGGETIHVTA